jgi:hypothetical protein
MGVAKTCDETQILMDDTRELSKLDRLLGNEVGSTSGVSER